MPRNRYRDFFDRVESRPLTERQRRAALTGEDATLVLAGAGSGKTSVLMARAGFILESGLAGESEILLLAFARKAQQEMAERIEARLGRKIAVSTFHGLGYAILGEAEGRRPNLSKLAKDTRLFRKTIARFIDDAATDPAYRSSLVHFFATLLFVPKPPEDFASRDAYLQYVRGIELRTLKDELVKGFGELAIANFLALNSIPYEYEKPYPVDTSDPRRRAYRPDFTLTRDDLYLEHFGLDRQGNTAPGVDRDAYLAGIRWKRALHEQQGTTLIETFSWQHFEGKLDDVLHQALAARGVAMVTADTQALLNELREAGKISRFAELVSAFLKLHKASDLTFEQLEARASASGDGGRTEAFLALYRPIRERYDRALADADEIDFEDMIHRAVAHVRAGRWRSPYRYVLVDEFQDISQDRADLLKALQGSRSDMRLFAVGDDWQSIYRFAGADLGLITHFAEHFGETATVELDLTFRMPDPLTDLASAFVQRNPVQTPRQIKATRAVPEPLVHLHWHPVATIADGGANGDHRHLRAEIDDGLAAVLATVGADTNDRQEVLLLGRYKHQKPRDLAKLQRAHPHLKIGFSTVHAAKGLEADVVVVLDLSVGRYGFPSGVTDDPLLSLVLADPDPFPHAEERRLFYVALTRAKRCVHLIIPSSEPSPFAREIAEASFAARQHGEPALAIERCPDCGGAMILRKARTDFLGCTNFPLCRGTRRAPPRSEGAPAAAPRVPSSRHTSALRDVRPPA
jgi:DNA helicase-4